MIISQRGHDWSHLRSYIDTDDIRDIAWNKMSPVGLSVRVRETQGDYQIISYAGETPYDGFYLDSFRESRAYRIEQSEYCIQKSAQFAGYQYNKYT